MHRHHHYLAAMVVVAFGFSLSTALLVATRPTFSAAPRNALSIDVEEIVTDDVLLAEQTDIVVERFTLRGGREDLLVDTLTFENCLTGSGHDDDGDCADSGEGAGVDATIASVALLYHDGTYDRRTRGTLADGRATFTNLELPVAAGGEVTVALRIATSAIDGSAVESGDQFQLNLNAISAPFHAVTASGTAVTEADVRKHVIGHVRTLRKTLAGLALAAEAPSGIVEDGWSEVFRVNATAAPTGDVRLQALTFALTVTKRGGGNWDTCPFLGASETNFALVDVATGATIPATWTTYDADGAACAASEDPVGYVHAKLTTPESIAAGATSTYSLYLDTTYAADDDMLQAAIPSESALADVTSAFHAVVWSDGVMSDIDGTEIDDLPVHGNLVIF